MKASGLRNFRYVAFPPIIFETPARAAAEATVEEPVALPGEPEMVLAPENEPPAPPEPMPALPPLSLRVEVPPEPVAMAVAPAPMPAEPPAPEPIPDPPSWSQPAPRRSGLRLLDEAGAAASPPPPPKPSEAPRRFAMLDDIQTELRPRRARTGRQRPGDLL